MPGSSQLLSSWKLENTVKKYKFGGLIRKRSCARIKSSFSFSENGVHGSLFMGCHSVVYIYSIMHVDCCEMLWLHNIIYTKHPILPSHLDFNIFFIRFYRCFIFTSFFSYFSKSYLNLLKKFFFLFLPCDVDRFSLQNYL